MLVTKRCGDDLTRSSDENKRGCYGGEEAFESLISGDRCLDNTCVWSEHKKKVEELANLMAMTVFSLALSAVDTILFTCSGMAIESAGFTRILTSASLVRASEKLRKYHDKLKIEVRYGGKVFKGYFEEYDLDLDIAIVYVRSFLFAHRVDFNEVPLLPGSKVVAVRRDISGKLMASSGILIGNSSESGSSSESGNSSESKNSSDPEDNGDVMLSSCKISEAWEGGPLVDFDGSFVGMNLFMVQGAGTVFLPVELIVERLVYFRTSLIRKNFFQQLKDLKRIRVGGRPTGDMPSPEVVVDNVSSPGLDSMGYPKPPVLHDGMTLIYSFEKTFGDVYGEGVWNGLSNSVSDTIRQNVVALASFMGEQRFFACTGFFIEWGDGYATVLTSASLVRTTGYANEINENLRIEVLLPFLKERKEGILLHYDLHYNIALVGVKNFRAARPVIFGHECYCDIYLAIGCCFNSGTLMAARGNLTSCNGKLNCRFLAYSTCQITKAGIGGPLVDIKGNFIGMNFYDVSVGTPYLRWTEIVKILAHFNGKRSFAEVGDDAIYSEPFWTMDGDPSGGIQNRWPVPRPYWSSDEVEEVPKLTPRGYISRNGSLWALD